MLRRLTHSTFVQARRGDETGTSLILVLVLVLVGGLIIGGLLDAAMDDIGNTANFAAARTMEADATSATRVAIQDIRYSPMLTTNDTTEPTLDASPPNPCWLVGTASAPQSSSITEPDGNEFTVWCSTIWDPFSTATRMVTFSTCPGSSSTESAAACAADPYMQAVVTFDDYPANLSPPSSNGHEIECNPTYCGSGLAVDSWLDRPALPTVASLSPSTESNTTGGQHVTIQGTGFGPGDTVSFVAETGGSPSSTNVVVNATSVQYLSATSLSVVTPPVSSGSTYYVTVTTPTGTSSYSSAALFTYTPQAPAVSGLTISGVTTCNSISGDPAGVVACGSTAGGTGVTVTGTGFLSGDTVTFVGTGGTPSVPVAAADITVNSSTSMSIVSPAVTTGSTYYVEVTTPGVGTSTTSSADEFWYFPIVPVVFTISPTSGGSGTTLTITGTGFFSGATAALYSESNDSETGSSVSLTSVTLVSATVITATVPTITTNKYGTTFFVVVTTPAGGSSGTPTPIYTY